LTKLKRLKIGIPMTAGKSADKVFKIVGVVLFATGISFLLAASFVYYRSVVFEKSAVSVEGRVVGFERFESRRARGSATVTYAAVVEFTDKNSNRRKFTESIQSSPRRFAPGETVAVLYDPTNPSDAIVDDTFGRWGLLIILAPLGLIFAGLGGGLLRYVFNKKRRGNDLIANGKLVMTRFLKVDVASSIKINGRSPFEVISQAENALSGELDYYRSEHLMDDPTPFLTGKQIPVFVDPQKPKSYHVDLRGLIPIY
jgi:Protein of unknown function (DUF3592)